MTRPLRFGYNFINAGPTDKGCLAREGQGF